MFANTCRHRGHELLAQGETSERRSILCPYHAWTYDLEGSLRGAKGFRDDEAFDADAHGLVELPVEVWEGWVFGHALHAVGSADVPSFAEHLGAVAAIVAPYACGELVLADRHVYEVAANWKVVAENYHECYHCPLIHPELCAVSPPDSGDNYDLPGSWVGGSMDLRDGMATMSLTGELCATPLPGVDPARVEYLHVLPNLLVSAHPDYVMTHRLLPLSPGRTWIECSWLVAPGPDGSVPDARGAVEFWDVTNRQDWAACESVQRGLASPHFVPGPFAPNEDAVAQLVSTIEGAYRTGGFAPSRGADEG
jgi:Rieske 2Fe-2S family protein